MIGSTRSLRFHGAATEDVCQARAVARPYEALVGHVSQLGAPAAWALASDLAAFIPSCRDAAVNEVAFAKVLEDKTRETRQGFVGSSVAHPDLVPLCAEVFDELMPTPNQVSLQRDVHVTADDLLAVADTPGARTLQGLRTKRRPSGAANRRSRNSTASERS
jgi:malate synthase